MGPCATSSKRGDTTVIWDRPHKALVNNTSNRSSAVEVFNVFHKLYPKQYFQEWMVFQLFELSERGSWRACLETGSAGLVCRFLAYQLA